MGYATTTDVQERMTRSLSTRELTVCATLLDDAAAIIDAYNAEATSSIKKIVSCKMVIRAIGDSGSAAGVPVGASQGSMSALGYSQSWTMGTGSVGEVYLSKSEKILLQCGNKIGSYSPVEELVPEEEEA